MHSPIKGSVLSILPYNYSLSNYIQKGVYLLNKNPTLMRVFLLLIILSCSLRVFACSGYQKSFCLAKSMRVADFVISGVITAKSGHSIELTVIDVLVGVETRSVIVIWDGTDFDCTGNISMKAADMGAIGDTIISILPMITSFSHNTWDVAGDYRRPYSLYETAWLNVINDSVRGYISGPHLSPVMKYSYTLFKNYWITHNNDCLALNVSEILAEKIKILVFEDRITILSLSEKSLSVKLFSIDGRLMDEIPADKQHDLNYSHLPSGIYMLKVSNDANEELIRKVIL